MPPVPIRIKPGVDVQSTPVSSGATSWNESRNIRFFQGLAQKMGGFEFFEDIALHGGRPTAMRAWSTLGGINELAVAGENLVSLISAQSLADITPYTGYQEIPIVLSTTLGETEVTVYDAAHEPAVGDWIRFVAPIAVGGIILDGPYRISEIVTLDSYKITAAVEARSTVVDGGSARVFATTAGSSTVTVTLVRHGLTSGDIARIPATVVVGGLSLYGNYVANVTSANVYEITAASDATANDSVTENGGNIAMELYTRRAEATGGTIVAYADSGTAAYTPAGQLTVTGGTGTAPVFQILYTEVVTVAINAVGAGGTPGVHTFRGTTGAVATNYFEFTAVVEAGGTLTGAVPTITLGGDYSANPTSLTGEPILDVTDGSLIGATVDVGMWPLLIAYPPLVPGNLSVIPPDPSDTTGGGGTGAQITIDWDYGSSAQNPLHVENVSLDTWGEFLVIVPKQGPVFIWQPSQGTTAPAENVLTAPQANTVAFVAGQQQVLVLCGSVSFASGRFDPMLVRTSEVGDYTVWAPSSTNQASSFRLQLGSEIIGALPIPGQNLIWTDLALYVMQYVNLPFVWAYNPIGINCGLAGPKAMAVIGDVVAWMGANQFYMRAGGSTPVVIPCSVWDRVFNTSDPAYLRQTHCTTNAYFGEIAWYVRQLDGTTTRAKLQVASGAWDYTIIEAGSVEARSAGIDQNVFGPPLGAHPTNNKVYKEETGTDAFNTPLEARLLTGIAMIAEGDQAIFFSKIEPDVKFANDPGEGAGTLKMTVYLYRDAQSAPRVKGPYPINARTRTLPCRGRARGLQFEFKSDDLGSAWRLGTPKWLGQSDGKGG